MRSHLLLLRVWPETVDEGKVEWRGRIQSLHSGEARYFRDAKTLYGALLRIIDELEDGSDASPDFAGNVASDGGSSDGSSSNERGGDFQVGPGDAASNESR